MFKIRRHIIILIIALIAKIAFGLYDFYSAPTVADENDYILEAHMILEQGPLVLEPYNPKTFVGPGFPWLLAFTQWIGGTNLIVWLNACLSVLTVILIYKIGKRVLKFPYVELAALWAVIYVPYTMYVGSVLKESLLQFLVVWSVYLAFRLRDQFSLSKVTLFAFAFVYMIHTDERYLFFLPIYALAVLKWDQRISANLKQISIVSLWIIVFCLPWFARNYVVYERPVFLTERLHAPIDKKFGIKNDLINRSEYFSKEMRAFQDSLLNGLDPQISMGREKSLLAAHNNGLTPHDFSFGERLWYNTLGYWSPIRTKGILLGSGWKYMDPRSPIVNILYTLNYGILLPFMLMGIYFTWRQGVFELKILSIYLAFHYILHIVMILGSGRYRHPVDFIIILLAFYGLYSLSEKFKWRLHSFIAVDSYGNTSI